MDPPPFKYEGKTYTHYEATQQQRAIERAVRKWKRREAAATNPEDKQAAQIRQRLLKQKYEEFSKAAHLRTQPERMKAYVPPKSNTLNRRTGNAGVFASLPERMSKKRVKEVAKEFDISLKGVTINIDADPEKWLKSLSSQGERMHKQ